MFVPSVRAVDAHFVNLVRVLAQILDVAQNMAAAVLADEVAQVSTQTHVRNSGLVVAPFLDGEALEQDETFAVEEIVAECLQVACQVGEAEVVLIMLKSGRYWIDHFAVRLIPSRYPSKASWTRETHPTQRLSPRSAPA